MRARFVKVVVWRLRSSRLLSRVIGIRTRKGTKVDWCEGRGRRDKSGDEMTSWRSFRWWRGRTPYAVCKTSCIFNMFFNSGNIFSVFDSDKGCETIGLSVKLKLSCCLFFFPFSLGINFFFFINFPLFRKNPCTIIFEDNRIWNSNEMQIDDSIKSVIFVCTFLSVYWTLSHQACVVLDSSPLHLLWTTLSYVFQW